MKKLIASLTICVLVCGCNETISANDYRMEDKLPLGVVVFSYKGHEYFYGSYAGFLHSESCPCKEKEASK